MVKSKTFKVFIFIVFFYFLIIFLTTFGAHFHLNRWISYVFVFFLVIIINLLDGYQENFGFFSAVIAGFFLDVFSEHFIGFYILIFLGVWVLIKLVLKRYIYIPAR